MKKEHGAAVLIWLTISCTQALPSQAQLNIQTKSVSDFANNSFKLYRVDDVEQKRSIGAVSIDHQGKISLLDSGKLSLQDLEKRFGKSTPGLIENTRTFRLIGREDMRRSLMFEFQVNVEIHDGLVSKYSIKDPVVIATKRACGGIVPSETQAHRAIKSKEEGDKSPSSDSRSAPVPDSQ